MIFIQKASIALLNMLYLTPAIVSLLLPFLVLTASVQENNRLQRRYWTDFDAGWPGLNWKLAFQECSDPMLSAIEVGVLDARILATAAYYSTVTNDGPFEQFFGSGWTGTRAKYLQEIWSNMNAARTYPFEGDSQGRYISQYQLTIRCNEVAVVPRCGNPSSRVVAYVVPGGRPGADGPQMVVCPDFNNQSWTGRPKSLFVVQEDNEPGPGVDPNLSALVSSGQVM